jgi:hypothetical protein
MLLGGLPVESRRIPCDLRKTQWTLDYRMTTLNNDSRLLMAA